MEQNHNMRKINAGYQFCMPQPAAKASWVHKNELKEQLDTIILQTDHKNKVFAIASAINSAFYWMYRHAQAVFISEPQYLLGEKTDMWKHILDRNDTLTRRFPFSMYVQSNSNRHDRKLLFVNNIRAHFDSHYGGNSPSNALTPILKDSGQHLETIMQILTMPCIWSF